MLDFLERTKPSIRFAAIGLDLYMFNERAFPFTPVPTFHGFDAVTVRKYLLSTDMFKFGVGTIANHLRGGLSAYNEDGSRNVAQRMLSERPTPMGRARILRTLREEHFRDFSFSVERLEVLRQLKRWADKQCVALVVWINPYHVAVLDLIRDVSADKPFLHLRTKSKTIFPDLLDLSDGQYSRPQYYWKDDPFHYYPSIASKIFDEQLSTVIDQKLRQQNGCREASAIR
jgi:hypothetical protein